MILTNGTSHITKKRNKLFLLLIFYMALAQLQGCALWYSAEPIEGWVVDANTKQPLKDVIVIANWELVEGGFGGSVTVGQIMIMEAVTDTNGRFSFPAWGPKIPKNGHLFTRDPQLLFFKHGYRLRNLENAFHHEYRDPTLRKSEWSGKIIELNKFEGGTNKYKRQFIFFNNTLDTMVTMNPEECNWKKIPLTIHEIIKERKQLEKAGINTYTLSSIDRRLISNNEFFTKKGGRSCGSPKDFLQEIIK